MANGLHGAFVTAWIHLHDLPMEVMVNWTDDGRAWLHIGSGLQEVGVLLTDDQLAALAHAISAELQDRQRRLTPEACEGMPADAVISTGD